MGVILARHLPCSAKVVRSQRPPRSFAKLCFARLRSYALHPTRHHTKFTKKIRKHEKEKDKFAEIQVVPLPRPPHEIFENQRNARKGGQGWMNERDWEFMRRK